MANLVANLTAPVSQLLMTFYVTVVHASESTEMVMV